MQDLMTGNPKFHRKRELLERVQRDGYRPIDASRVEPLPKGLYSQLMPRSLPDATSSKAFDYLRLLLDPQKTVLPAMEKLLAHHLRPARRGPVEVSEFWLCFAKWLVHQIKHSPQAPNRLEGEIEISYKGVKDQLTKDRYATLLAAFQLPEIPLNEAFLDHRQRLASFVKPGNLLVIDESILACNSRLAKREGKMRYIPGKPHPKGLFVNMGIQKLLYCRFPVVYDAECKWSYESLSMCNALLAIVARLEKQFGMGFLVLADSGYPASVIIDGERKRMESKFICSVSTAKVSGGLRHLADAACQCLPVGRKTLLFNQDKGMIAFAHRQTNYTQVLVTNACTVVNQPPLRVYPRPTTFQQACALARHFSVDEMVELLAFPAPDTNEMVGYDRYPAHYIFKVTGHDISGPLDAEGYVSKDSLLPLNIEAIRGIAEHCNINHRGRKKKELVDLIIKRHPKAKPPEPPTRYHSKKRSQQANNASPKEAEHMEVSTNNLIEQIMPDAGEPEFAILYKKNYGLQDRFNAIIYRYFAQHRCKTATSKYTWLYFYVCLWNAFALWTEKQTKDIGGERDESADLIDIEFTRFLLDIVEQVGANYAKR